MALPRTVGPHGGWTVFYQVSGDRLPLYVDLGLAVDEDRGGGAASAADFSLEGRPGRNCARNAVAPSATAQASRCVSAAAARAAAARAPRRSPRPGSRTRRWRRRASRSAPSRRATCAAFRSPWCAAGASRSLLPACGSPVRRGDRRGSHALRPGCAARSDGLPVRRADAVGRAQGYRWLNLGMAPLAGLEQHPLAPAWHRVGNFVFRYGEHFYNFDGLRRYKAKFSGSGSRSTWPRRAGSRCRACCSTSRC